MYRFSLRRTRRLSCPNRPNWLISHDRPLKSGYAATLQHSVQLPFNDSLSGTVFAFFQGLTNTKDRLQAASRFYFARLDRAQGLGERTGVADGVSVAGVENNKVVSGAAVLRKG